MSRGRTTRVLTRRVDTDGNRRVPDDLIVEAPLFERQAEASLVDSRQAGNPIAPICCQEGAVVGDGLTTSVSRGLPGLVHTESELLE